MKIGRNRTDIKNNIILTILQNQEILKALVIDSENFLDVSPTTEQANLLNNPELLIRSQIFPYKKVNIKMNNDKSFLTMQFVDFEKSGHNYQRGVVYFYAIVPNSLEKTNMGLRYDFIMEKLEEIFFDTGLGKFEYFRSGDMDVNDNYMGSFVAFEIEDMYGW